MPRASCLVSSAGNYPLWSGTLRRMSDMADTGNVPRRQWRITGMIFFGIVVLAVLWATVMIIRPFITAIVLGGMLVTITYPLYVRVRNRLHGRAGVAAVLMLLFLLVIIIIPASILGMLLVQQANVVIADLQSGEATRLMQRIDLPSHFMWVKRFVPGFNPATINPERLLLPAVQQIPGWVARNGAAVVGRFTDALMTFAFVLLSSYFFYVEGESILTELTTLSPLPSQYDRQFGLIFKDVIDATFRGHVLTAIAQGTVTTIGLAIAHVPGALFWGFVATVLSLLPLVGAPVIWIPATIYLYITASMGERSYFGAIFLTIWGLVVVSLIDNVIRPWVMKGNAQMPAIPLLVAVIGGMQAFGFIGLVIGPLVFSLLMSVIDIYKRSFQIPQSESDVA
jgi:predicted PurR-regulated permease PerM